MQIDRADRSTPTDIRTELARYGGINPFGRANWRVVLAEDRLVKRGGVFTTMPSGNVAAIEVDPKTFRIHHREVKPERVQTGFLDVPKYPVRGWVMERWFPARCYGSRSAWESVKSSDGFTPMMGPYPHEGEYFMLAGPWEKIPEMGDLKTAISMHLREEESNTQNYEQAMRSLIDQDTERYEKEVREYADKIAHFYATEVAPVMKGTSLAAGRLRNELAEAMGDRTHQGVA